jgi:hypothetical protein
MSRQIDIDHRNVGSRIEKSREAGPAVLRLDDLDIRIRLQKRPASRYDNRMVIDDKHPQKLEPSLADQAMGRTSRISPQH